jgi:hypothetical protein
VEKRRIIDSPEKFYLLQSPNQFQLSQWRVDACQLRVAFVSRYGVQPDTQIYTNIQRIRVKYVCVSEDKLIAVSGKDRCLQPPIRGEYAGLFAAKWGIEPWLGKLAELEQTNCSLWG